MGVILLQVRQMLQIVPIPYQITKRRVANVYHGCCKYSCCSLEYEGNSGDSTAAMSNRVLMRGWEGGGMWELRGTRPPRRRRVKGK